jgi:hypothetical protein
MVLSTCTAPSVNPLPLMVMLPQELVAEVCRITTNEFSPIRRAVVQDFRMMRDFGNPMTDNEPIQNPKRSTMIYYHPLLTDIRKQSLWSKSHLESLHVLSGAWAPDETPTRAKVHVRSMSEVSSVMISSLVLWRDSLRSSGQLSLLTTCMGATQTAMTVKNLHLLRKSFQLRLFAIND